MITRPKQSPGASSPRLRNPRRVVLGAALGGLAVKLCVAHATYGTNDIVHWTEFANVVRAVGPIRIYGTPTPNSLYNHPPLIGYFLMLVNLLRRHGVPLQFTIRAAASLADVVSAVLVFELLRRRRSLREATGAGVLVGLSPVLFVVSGFHGNTDPIFAMLTLLGVWLLADRDMPAASGVALALALSVKLVPVVVVPCLLVYALRRSLQTALRFAAALAVVFLAIWTPALLREWGPIRRQVLGYTGSAIRQWGLPQFARSLGVPGAGAWLAGGGRLLCVVVCAVGPAVLLWRRPRLVVEATGVAMCAFLLLSPAFGTQYLAWPLAFAYLVGFWPATAYNALAGALLLEVYTRWNDGSPWWNVAHALAFTPAEVVFAAVVWASLAVVTFRGVSLLVTRRRPVQRGRHAVERY
jgi:Glycosyltransferase family 87